MSSEDIFSIVSSVLNNYYQDDINGLYNLSQTCKQMNTIVHKNSNYDVLKKIARFPKIYKAVCYHISNTIDVYIDENNVVDIEKAKEHLFQNTSYFTQYITSSDLNDLSRMISVLYEDWLDTSIPCKNRDQFLIEAKLLVEFIKEIDNNFNICLILSFEVENNDKYIEYEDEFQCWLTML